MESKLCIVCKSEFFNKYFDKKRGYIPYSRERWIKMKCCSVKCFGQTKRKVNEMRIINDVLYIKYKDKEIICDAKYYNKVKGYCWRLDDGYGKTTDQKKGYIFLHHLILKRKKGIYIDHINRNRLDNRKKNLRYVLPRENAWNRSLNKNNKTGFSGVYKTGISSYIARIRCKRKTINLGTYPTIQLAIEARKRAEQKYWKLKTATELVAT